jgi:hypothetical protein
MPNFIFTHFNVRRVKHGSRSDDEDAGEDERADVICRSAANYLKYWN